MRQDNYCVYIVDWLLPDMNGVEVTRRIRKEMGEDVPIIVLTTAISPFSATSRVKPASSRMAWAISWFSSLSSASRMRPVWRSGSTLAALTSSGVSALITERRQRRSSERNRGLLQKAVTPASLASSSMSDP